MTQHRSARMPAVARGAASWSAEDLDHLAGCADCAAEWLVIQHTLRLGSGIGDDVDWEAVAAGVNRRLRAEPPVRRISRAPIRWIALAAAAIALAVVYGVRTGSQDGSPAPRIEQALLPELEALELDELRAVLEVLPPTGALPAGGPAGLDDLTDDELESVIRSLEGS